MFAWVGKIKIRIQDIKKEKTDDDMQEMNEILKSSKLLLFYRQCDPQ